MNKFPKGLNRKKAIETYGLDLIEAVEAIQPEFSGEDAPLGWEAFKSTLYNENGYPLIHAFYYQTEDAVANTKDLKDLKWKAHHYSDDEFNCMTAVLTTQ